MLAKFASFMLELNRNFTNIAYFGALHISETEFLLKCCVWSAAKVHKTCIFFANLLGFEKCWKTHISSQKSASIQPRTSPPKKKCKDLQKMADTYLPPPPPTFRRSYSACRRAGRPWPWRSTRAGRRTSSSCASRPTSRRALRRSRLPALRVRFPSEIQSGLLLPVSHFLGIRSFPVAVFGNFWLKSPRYRNGPMDSWGAREERKVVVYVIYNTLYS